MKTLRLGVARWGFAFVTLILIGAIFMALAGAMGTQVVSVMDASRKRMGHSACRFAAYAGLQHALLLLRFNPGWNAGIPTTSMPGNPSVSYSVEITNNLNGTDVIHLAGGLDVPVGAVYCASMGINETEDSKIQLHAMTGIMAQGNPTLYHAAFTENTLSLTGSSQSSSYDPATAGLSLGADGRADAATTSSQGAVGSNRYAHVDSTARVHGDLYKPSSLAMSLASGVVSGSVLPLSDPVTVPIIDPPVEFDSPAAALTNPGTLSSSNPSEAKVIEKLTLQAGQTLTVDPGKYFFPDGIDIDGNVQFGPTVDADHPVQFFVGNDARFGDGARVNVMGSTRNLQVVLVDHNDGTPQTFAMEGKSQIFGAVFSGKAEGTIAGESSLYGAFIGRSLTCSENSQLVYDQSLSSSPLRISTAWGLHGVTEPKPDIVLAAYPVLKTRVDVLAVAGIQSGLAPVSVERVMAPTGSEPIGVFEGTALPVKTFAAPIDLVPAP